MYKNQLQELAQRSCFNLPAYACIREGPDHAPRFRASVNFNGEIFEGPNYCTTLRQAEHAAAEVALNTLSTRGPSRSLAARVLDETGVYKNLLQETAHRAGLNLPVYTTVRSGPGHLPVFTCTVELATMSFTGESAKTKKQAEKNAAMAAWSALKQLPNLGSLSQTSKESENSEEQEQVVVARALSIFRPKDEINNRSMRQREQQQTRRRMMLNSVNVSSHNNNLQYHQWRSFDLLSDISVYQQQQPQNCYLALPAPPCSRILPPKHPVFQQSNNSQEPSSSRVPIPSFSAIPVQIRNRSQVKIHEIPAPLEEHQKDEDEWLNGKSDVTAKSIERDTNSSSSNAAVFRQKATFSRPFSLPDQKTQQTQTRTGYIRPPQPPLMAAPVRTRPVIPPRMGRACGEFRPPNTMAPAVNIRSVIPVCAAPPMRPPSYSPNPTTQKKEGSSEEGEISATSSKLQL